MRDAQWIVLYGELALRRTAPETAESFLDVEQLKVLGRWSLKDVRSVGKEMARHLRNLERWGFSDMLVHQGKTIAWRLALAPSQIVFVPSREACEDWLRSQNFDYLGGLGRIPGEIVEWLISMARALIRFQQGHVAQARSHLQAAKRSARGSVLLAAITDLVRLRLLARRGAFPEGITRNLAAAEGKLGEALRVRAKLARALQPSLPGHEGEALEEMRHLILDLETLPDVNGLGVAHNALAVRLRRQGKLELAGRSLRYAAALLIATFDIPTLQAAIFNLGHTRQEAAKTDRELEEAMGLVLLDREIHRELGLGADTPQAEIVAGLICLKLGKVGEAEGRLAAGKEIAARVSNDYNSAGIRLLEARIHWVKGLGDLPFRKEHWDTTLVHFDQAARLSESAGHDPREILAEKERFRLRLPPLWLPSWH